MSLVFILPLLTDSRMEHSVSPLVTTTYTLNSSTTTIGTYTPTYCMGGRADRLALRYKHRPDKQCQENYITCTEETSFYTVQECFYPLLITFHKLTPLCMLPFCMLSAETEGERIKFLKFLH